jgi:hypothetical protein
LRGDLSTASKSIAIVGPWLDDYFAEQLASASSPNLSVRAIVRDETQMDPIAWNRTFAALSIFAGHWRDFKAKSLEKLHAKVLCIDDRIAYVGSANWYRYSLENSLEAVLKGPKDEVAGFDEVLDRLWRNGRDLTISGEICNAGKLAAKGIDYEILDPIAARILKEDPKAFILRRSK